MLYLLRWARQCPGFEPSGKLAQSVDTLCWYLNGTFVDVFAESVDLPSEDARLIHICLANCPCREMPNARAEVARRFRLLVFKVPAKFSEGRWTAASPSVPECGLNDSQPLMSQMLMNSRGSASAAQP